MNCPNCEKKNIQKLYVCGKPGEEKTVCDKCKDDRNKIDKKK